MELTMEKLDLQNELKGVCDEWLELFDLSNWEKGDIYFSSPSKGNVFNAFKLFRPNETKIIIIGQDPYPDEKYPDKADGLSFSQNGKNPAVDSLKNIYSAINLYNKKNDINNWNTDLTTWATNNKVLLLNTALTYNLNENHYCFWKSFVEKIVFNLIENMNKKENSKLVVFLWGVPSQQIFFNCISKKFKTLFLDALNSEEQKKFKMGKLIKNKIICIENKKIFLTSHPCNMSAWRGFKKHAPEHFKLCDIFLENNIWKDFPKNNQ